jgi:hypothetical protein
LTALVETFDGELKIIHWPHILDDANENSPEPIVLSSYLPIPLALDPTADPLQTTALDSSPLEFTQ